MPEPCSERDRLKEAYHQATLEASVLSGALDSLPSKPEFQWALQKAEGAQLACIAARHEYEDHCTAHGCEDEFDGPLR